MNEEITPEQQAKLELELKRATAVRMAMVEVLNEHRDEIISRARAKLLAQGLSTAEADVGTMADQ